MMKKPFMMKRSHSPYMMSRPSSRDNSSGEVQALDLSKSKNEKQSSPPPISTVIKSEPTSPDKTSLWPEAVEQTINYDPPRFQYFSHISPLSIEKANARSQSIEMPFVQSQLTVEPYFQPQSTTAESRIQPQRSLAMDVSSSTRNSPDSSGSSLLVPGIDLVHPLPLLSPSTAKPTRPFKAYPKEIMTDGAFYDPEMQIKYEKFKKDFFSNTTNYTQSTNPKMRRTNTRTHSEDDGGKDEAYRERRRKNNDAAKRSRDARRKKEDEIAIKAAFLEKENLELKATIKILYEHIDTYCKRTLGTAVTKMLN